MQSIFPAWKFSAADSIAAYGLHGAYFVGPQRIDPRDGGDWARMLSSFEIDLYRNDERMDRGHVANVLDGPLHALLHLIDVLQRDAFNPPLAAGELVTTGTLTRAFPVRAGEVWTTQLHGVSIDGITIRFH